ncbi:MAG: sulfotransferase, partial [Psychroflexus sp.]|nr:sulfotransferase [Psychroflexus sp.]
MHNNKLPNFLIAGFAKCGTTSLVNYIKNHEEIFICKEKELRYLTYDLLKKKGYKGHGDENVKNIAVKSLDEYKSHFNTMPQHSAIGEATADTAYYYKHTIPKIKNILGDPKIIILLRDPVKRAISAYSHLVREERETLNFEDALNAENERLKSGFEYIWGYKQSSMYYESIRAYKENFTNVKIILFEDLIENPNKEVKNTLSFLEVNESYQFRKTQFNRSGRPKNTYLNRFLIKKSRFKD